MFRAWASLGVATSWAVLLLTWSERSRAASIEIRNLDLSDVGLNDPGPAQPVSGNPGQTLGEQRLAAVQFAANAWATRIQSPVPIIVEVAFEEFESCAIGGSAWVGDYVLNEPGLQRGVAYPVALAEALVGEELNAGAADIVLRFNASPCQDLPQWYLGLDGNPPEGDADFTSAILHELAHGLGLSSTIAATTGSSMLDVAALDPFSRNLYDVGADKAWIDMTADEIAASVTRPRGLVWTGANVAAVARWKLGTNTPRISLEPAVEGFDGLLSEAASGPHLTQRRTELLRAASPQTACEPQPNNGIASVMLAFDGDCSLEQKANNAFGGGAVAMILVQDSDRTPPRSIQSSSELALPVLGVNASAGELLAALGTTEVALTVAEQRVGADPEGRPYVLVEDPPVLGVGLSHWDSLLRPSALLEAVLSRDTPFLELSMELAALADIGWTVTLDDPASIGVDAGTEFTPTDAGAKDRLDASVLLDARPPGTLPSNAIVGEDSSVALSAPDASASEVTQPLLSDALDDGSSEQDASGSMPRDRDPSRLDAAATPRDSDAAATPRDAAGVEQTTSRALSLDGGCACATRRERPEGSVLLLGLGVLAALGLRRARAVVPRRHPSSTSTWVKHS